MRTKVRERPATATARLKKGDLLQTPRSETRARNCNPQFHPSHTPKPYSAVLLQLYCTRHVMASVQTAHAHCFALPPRTASHCGPQRQPNVATSSPRPMLCAGALYRWRHMFCFLSSDSSPIPSHASTHPRTNLPARRHMLIYTPDAALQTQPPQTSFVRRAA